MANQSLQTDKDVEADGGTLHWQMDIDERQISSDLEKILRFPPPNEKDIHVLPEPKQETRSACMFTSSGDGVRGESLQGEMTSTFIQGSNQNYDFSAGSVWLHNESNSVPWSIPSDSGKWRQGSSLSSNDLEMDREPSMVPFNRIMSPSCNIPGVDTSKIQLDPGINDSVMKYPHEDKLMRYNGQSESEFNNYQHQLWQQQISAPLTTTMLAATSVGPITDDGMEEEDVTYSFEVDEYGEGPLHTLSVIQDKFSLAKNMDVLLQCGVVASCINLQNKLKQTPLFLAVMEGNLSFVIWLLDHGADPNIQGTLYVDRYDYIWRSPLHLAAMKGDDWLYILRALLNKQDLIDINSCSHGDKLTALHLALKNHSASFNCRQTILELVKHDADISIRDQSSSKTPLMLALETRDIQLVEEFMNSFPAERCRIMMQEQTRSGDTCLHIAAGLSRITKNDKLKLLRLLVINGANGNTTNNARELPRDLARGVWDCIRKS
ncbi:hypothetical protein ACF0H5_012362 [Mactra antiquata]